MNASLQKHLPQGGTGQAGESSPSSSDGGCPSYSGGGKERVRVSTLGGEEDVAVGVVGGSAPGKFEGVASRREARVVLSRCSSVTSVRSCDGRFFRLSSGETMDMSDADTDDTLTNISGGSQQSLSGGGSKQAKSARPSRADFLRPPKRPLPSEEEGISDVTGGAPKTAQKAKRGRVKSAAATTGLYIGKSEAQRELNAARKAQTEAELEQRVLAKEKEARDRRAKAGFGAAPRAAFEDMPIPDIEKSIDDNLDLIVDMAGKSSNLKGTFQRGFKDCAHNVKAGVGEIVRRKVSEETQMLQATNIRLQAEMDDLKRQVAELRAALGSRRARGEIETSDATSATVTPSTTSKENLQDFQNAIRETLRQEIQQESLNQRAFTRACLAGIEDRLLPEKRMRPPLAADRRREAESECFKAPEPPKPQRLKRKTRATRPSPSGPNSDPPSKTSTLVASKPVATSAAEMEEPFLPATTPANEGWSTVVKRGKKGKKTNPTPSAMAPTTVKPKEAAPDNTKGAASKKKKKKKKKLSPPNTAAVVVTLTEEATAKGETYESILRRARQSMGDADIGPARCRQTQTGARKFEFPGAQSTVQADNFASRLKEAIADVAKITRPQKCIGLVISDLDDSVSRSEVVEKLAAAGGCSADSIRAGEIRTGRGGVGAIRLFCPITAARTVLEKGRLLVGFSSAAVRALEDRPLRCYRCYGVGHTSALCPSNTERARLCFRCGKEGHKAAACGDKVRCAVCADCGRPAGHIMGGAKCNPPPKKGKVKATVRPNTSSPEDHSTTRSSCPAGEDQGAMSE